MRQSSILYLFLLIVLVLLCIVTEGSSPKGRPKKGKDREHGPEEKLLPLDDKVRRFVEVNGEKCQICANNVEGITVSCLNLEGGFAIQTCDIEEAGYLEVFYEVHPSELSGCAPLVMYTTP
jgi:hypothetical protein